MQVLHWQGVLLTSFSCLSVSPIYTRGFIPLLPPRQNCFLYVFFHRSQAICLPWTCTHVHTHTYYQQTWLQKDKTSQQRNTHTHPFVLYVSNPEALLQLQWLPDVPSAGQDITIPTRLFSGFNVLPIHLNLLYLAPGGQIVYKHTFIRTKWNELQMNPSHNHTFPPI